MRAGKRKVGRLGNLYSTQNVWMLGQMKKKNEKDGFVTWRSPDLRNISAGNCTENGWSWLLKGTVLMENYLKDTKFSCMCSEKCGLNNIMFVLVSVVDGK